MARFVLPLAILVACMAVVRDALADRPQVYGHRGASAEAPENTVHAFRAARRRGADGVELDVRRARSGEIVVVHDARVRLASGERARVSRSDYRDLRKLGIPTLAEAIRSLGPKLRLNIEIKAESPFTRGLEREVVRIVRETGIGDRVIISSFNPLSLARVKKAAPELKVGLLFKGLPQLAWAAPLVGAATLHPHEALVDQRSLARWHGRGYPVYTWTVDDPARMQELAKLGVDGILTDDPALARRVLH